MIISFFSCLDEKVGFPFYSLSLAHALEKQGATVNIVQAPKRKSMFRFFRLGNRMNMADAALIQHEYSFFSDNRIPILFPFLSLLHFAVLLSRLTIPTVVTVHEVMSSHITNPAKRFAARLFLRFFSSVLNRCHRIIVHTDRFRDILVRHGADEHRVLFVPHPFPPPAQPSVRVNEAVHNFRQSQDLEHKTILSIFGFVHARKGYEIALAAIKNLDNCVLLIAGGPHENAKTYYDKLLTMIADQGMQDKVRILQYIDEKDMDTVMFSTDIFLIPYLEAPGSGSLCRMSVYHKPLVATDIPTVRELKERGFGAELCKPGDSHGLREAILNILNNETRKNQLIHETDRFIEEHSYESYARFLLTILKA